MVDDVLEVDESALQLPSVDGLGGLARVLERDTQVRAPSTGALCVRNRLCGVADLCMSVYFTICIHCELVVVVVANCDGGIILDRSSSKKQALLCPTTRSNMFPASNPELNEHSSKAHSPS